jgi:hypothetical protein
LDKAWNLLDVLLGGESCLNSGCVNARLLLNSKYQTYWNKCLSKFAESWSVGLLGLHVLKVKIRLYLNILISFLIIKFIKIFK